VITAIFEKIIDTSAYLGTYVRKAIGDSSTVASGTMGEQRGTPTPVELHWIGHLL